MDEKEPLRYQLHMRRKQMEPNPACDTEIRVVSDQVA